VIKTLDTFEFQAQPSIQQKQVRELMVGQYVDRRDVLPERYRKTRAENARTRLTAHRVELLAWRIGAGDEVARDLGCRRVAESDLIAPRVVHISLRNDDAPEVYVAHERHIIGDLNIKDAVDVRVSRELGICAGGNHRIDQCYVAATDIGVHVDDRSRGVRTEVLDVGHGEFGTVLLLERVDLATEVQSTNITNAGQWIADVNVAGKGGILPNIDGD